MHLTIFYRLWYGENARTPHGALAKYFENRTGKPGRVVQMAEMIIKAVFTGLKIGLTVAIILEIIEHLTKK